MKKLITTVFGLLCLVSGVSAQSLQLLEKDYDIAQHHYYEYVSGTEPVKYLFMVKNLTDRVITYKVMKIENEVPTNCTPNNISFCDLTSCYPNSESISNNNTINPYAIKGNSSPADYGLKIEFLPGTCPGNYDVTFLLENVMDALDTTSVTIHLFVGVGLEEQAKFGAKMEIYPNPMVDKGLISCSFNSPISKAEVQISNVLGEKVQTLPVSTNDSQVEVDLSGQASGIYFCTLWVDGVPTLTQKWVKP